MTEKEYRSASWTASKNDDKISGYALTFNQRYVLFKDKETGLDYGEIIDYGALDQADFSDCYLNVDHAGMVYARTRNGSLKLTIDSHGLKVDADLSGRDSGKELMQSIRSGLYDSMSFAFTVAKETYDDRSRTRHIISIDKVYDVAVVAAAANPNTEVHARSLDAAAEAERRSFRVAEVEALHKSIEEMAYNRGVNELAFYDSYPEFRLTKRECIEKKMAEIRASVLNTKGSDDVELARRSLESMQSLENEIRALEKKEAEVRAAIMRGEGKVISSFTFDNFYEKRNNPMNEVKNFYSNLIEKRAAAGTSGMSNVIPQEITEGRFRSGNNGLMNDISISHIANGGSVKIPYMADADITVSSHTENASITPNGTVPSVVTITHAEYQETLGYSYLGMSVAESDLRNIISDGLLGGMSRKLDSVAVAAVNALTWVKTSGSTQNAVQWAASGAPKLSEILDLMGLLPARYTGNAKFYMNQKTALSIIKNSTGTVLTPSDDTAVSSGMYNVNVTNGLEKIFGRAVVIDSNMSDGDVLYGDGNAVHMNFSAPVELSNWLDRDSLTEKFQVACAAGAGCEVGAFVRGANSIS